MLDQIRELPFAAAMGTLFVIVMLRANATYWLGRAALRGGRSSERLRARMSGPGWARAERLSDRFGIVAVPLSFLTIGVQTAINFSAGMTHMSLRRYLPAVAVGCVMWAFVYASAGTVAIEPLWHLVNRS